VYEKKMQKAFLWTGACERSVTFDSRELRAALRRNIGRVKAHCHETPSSSNEPRGTHRAAAVSTSAVEMPATTTLIGGGLGFCMQMYINALRKLPVLRSASPEPLPEGPPSPKRPETHEAIGPPI
jgi:hypothetical protein